MSKVFCIGFHKTGTTSMGEALETLGYRVTGPNWIENPQISVDALSLACETVPKYDAFQDNPWPILYKELDHHFPGSIFILTIRDPESWIKSVVDHFGTIETPMRRWIYGVGHPVGNEQTYINRFNQHNAEVLQYFKGRDLLVLDLLAGDGWDKLCQYLGKPIPDVPFPHLNKAEDRNAGLCSNTASHQRLHQ